MTLKCGENEKMAHKAQLNISPIFFHILTSSVIYCCSGGLQHVLNGDVINGPVFQSIMSKNQSNRVRNSAYHMMLIRV